MQTHSLLLMAPGQLAWVAETLPLLKADEVLVQTKAGAISIGTELPQYLGTARSTTLPHYPKMTGYESIGTVIACGSAIQRLRLGDRVVAFYGHRTHAIVPEAKVIHEKELTIVGSSDGADYQGHAKWYFKTAHAYAHILEQMFDYRTQADDLISTFEKLASGTIVPVKVLVQYNITRERE